MRAFSIAPSAVLLLTVAAVGPCSTGPAHPERGPRSGYEIGIASGGGEFETVEIGAGGDGCERFTGHEDAERVCFISTVVIPTAIGGEAYGELNDRRTPALDALIWRARLDADPATCAAGGLVGGFLAECERDAVATDYEYAVANIRVRVPVGGAGPVTTDY
jgi:hypothetical protein